MAGAMKVVSMLLVLALVAAAPIDGAITCGQVVSAMGPCVNYLRTGGTVPAPCCNGVRTLNSAARTTPDRQQACECLKSAAGGISGLNPNRAAGLPAACKINIPYKISTSTNCKTVR